MFSKKDRVVSLLQDARNEMDLLMQMSNGIHTPEDFVANLSFRPYSAIPWNAVFGMRNFLAHEYGDVDAEGFFNTIKTSIPELIAVTGQILSDIQTGIIIVEEE